MTSQNTFRCAIIGEGSLPIQCAEILLRRGHSLALVLTPDPALRAWATQQAIAHAGVDTISATLAAHGPLDYLFSVANRYLLPAEALALASQGAINYHDSPLPRYAGVNATAWAIMHGETAHAVTWHRMAESIDAGDILWQEPVPIAPDDTTLTLNARCYEAAVASFAALIDALERGATKPLAQELGQRSYFGNRRRPAGSAMLDFTRPAAELANLVRALQYGPYPNPLALPRLLLPGGWVAVAEAEALDGPIDDQPEPGVILGVDDAALLVATSAGALALRRLTSLEGQRLALADAIADNELVPGLRLPTLDPAAIAALGERDVAAARAEQFWAARLAQAVAPGLPYLREAAHVSGLSGAEHVSGLSGREHVSGLSGLSGAGSPRLNPLTAYNNSFNPLNPLTAYNNPLTVQPADLIAALAAYLARFGEGGPFDLAWYVGGPGVEAELFAAWVPLRVADDPAASYAVLREALAAELALVGRHSSFARDLIARQPTLRDWQPLPIGVALTAPPSLSKRGQGSAAYDPALTLVIDGAEQTYHWRYDPRRIAADDVARVAEQFATLLGAALADPALPIGGLPLLGDAERQRLLVGWNATDASFASERCFHQLVAEQAARTPDAIALASASEQVSYAELNARANRLAHYLRARGAGPETIVGLFIERSPELVVGLLAIMKAGAAYLPLDPAYPEARLRFMLEDARPVVVISAGRWTVDGGRGTVGGGRVDGGRVDGGRVDGGRWTVDGGHMDGGRWTVDGGRWTVDGGSVDSPRAPTGDTVQRPPSTVAPQALPSTVAPQAQIIDLSVEAAAIAACPASALPELVGPDGLAYVIYTSGSTGQPKGVLVEHRGLSNLVGAFRDSFDLRPADRVLQFSSPSFDASLFDLVMALGAGATLFLAPREDLLPGPGFIELIERQRITSVAMPPSVLAALPLASLPTLRTLIVGGEACPPDLAARWAAGRRFFNVYGPTEATIWATVAEWRVGDGPPPIGRPIANTHCYIVDKQLQPMPVGVAGELLLGGVGLARGYLNRPELTAERFIANPFGPSRLYRTGDLVRYRADSQIEFLGRIDSQVKLRGFRIELDEIAAALRAHPNVLAATAMVREDRPGERRLVAYVVPTLGPAVSRLLSELRGFLAARLPDYMVPAYLVPLAALPLSPSGKLDRAALPPPPRSRAEPRPSVDEPRTPAERSLAAIWAQVLGLEQVGIHDNFFELGGDSILGIQIVARANQAGLKLSARTIFQHQTVAELARAASASAAPIEQGPVSGELPLTPIQHWFFEADQPEPQHWNMALLLACREPLQPGLLAVALDALVEHHDALRLRYNNLGGDWKQRIEPPGQATPLAWLNLIGLPPAEQRARAQAAIAEAQQGLDLARGPLLRVVYLHTDSEAQQDDSASRSSLLITVHHLAIDGVSWGLLLEDLSTLYNQLSQGEQLRLPPKTSSFKSWAERLSAHATSGALLGELDFWLAERHHRAPRLPLDGRPEPAELREGAAQTISASLSLDETRALLQEVPPIYRTQINDALLAALLLSLSGWTGERTLLLDLEGHGREELIEGADLSRTVGWFTSSFPLLLELPSAGGWRADPGTTLRAVRDQLARLPQRGVGYGLLRYLAGPEVARQLSGLPQAAIAFNYLGQRDRLLAQADLFSQVISDFGVHGNGWANAASRNPSARRPYLFDITCTIDAGQLQLAWNYSPAAHQRATVERLAEGFMAALRSIIAHCQAVGSPAAQPHASSVEQWPLAPGQRAMIRPAQARANERIYQVQWAFEFSGPLDAERMRSAWQRLLARHPAMRASFALQANEVRQIFHPHADLPWQQEDWRGLSAAEQQMRLASFANDEPQPTEHYDYESASLSSVAQPISDLAATPLLRLALLRLADDRHALLWSQSHLIVDGWSFGPLWRDLKLFYSGREPSGPAPDYRDYLRWLERRSPLADEAFWRTTLRGVAGGTPVPMTVDGGRRTVDGGQADGGWWTVDGGQADGGQADGGQADGGRRTVDGGRWTADGSHVDESLALLSDAVHRPPSTVASAPQAQASTVAPQALYAALRELARRERLTLNTLVQGALALLLARHSQADDVIFGVTSAGRPAELAGVEEMVGLFINTLPLRAKIAPDAPLIGWLRRLQQGQVAWRPHEQVALEQLAAWAGLAPNQPLFEVVLRFQNYPLDDTAWPDGLRVRPLALADRWPYPLCLIVEPARELTISASYDRRRVTDGAAQRILEQLQALLASMARQPNARLGELIG